MPKFGTRSKKKLEGVHPHLVHVAELVVGIFDISVVQGVRTEQQQQELYAIGRTKEVDSDPVTNIDGINRKSNHQVKNDGYGYAIDCYPYPIDLNNKELSRARFYVMWGLFLAVSSVVLKGTGYRLRWGGDWDSDLEFKDQKFHDLPHIELVSVDS